MKKILLVFGGAQFSTGVFDLACKLNEMQPVLLVGAFLPDVVFANIYTFGTGLPGTDVLPVVDDTSELVKKNIERFEKLCQRNGIAYRVHTGYDSFVLSELKRETLFSDLMILSSEKFYDNFGFNEANPTLKDALHISKCPAIVVPEKFTYPQRNILAYDGSESSVYAIKQFAYLFPDFCGNETLLIYVKDQAGFHLPDESYIEELATQHFKNLDILNLQINSHKYFNRWLANNKDSLLISGSFSRSEVSEFIRKSFIAETIKELKMPVFVAHC